MVILLILFVLLGVLIGILTGLMPGLHINLVASAIVFFLPFLKLDPLLASILILSISITHIFLDFIPTTFLGIPTPDNATSLLPSHELVLKGKAHEAIFLSALGCLLGILLISSISPFLFPVVYKSYSTMSRFIPYLLILSLLILLLKENNKIWALITLLAAGIFGIASFSLNINHVLFPIFSGLFGLSSLIASINWETNIPEQDITEVKISSAKTPLILIKSLLASLLVGFLPGTGPAQASVIATSLSKNNERKDYIMITAAINSIVMVIAVIALFTINKARNGAVAIISGIFPESLTWQYFALFLAVILLASGIAAIATITISKIFLKIFRKINYRLLSFLIIFIITAMVILISGAAGLLILAIATCIGLIPIAKKVSRNHLMACLIVPIVLYYLL